MVNDEGGTVGPPARERKVRSREAAKGAKRAESWSRRAGGAAERALLEPEAEAQALLPPEDPQLEAVSRELLLHRVGDEARLAEAR